MLKRAIDTSVALAGLVVLAPLLALIAGWIRCESRGPVLFRQVRVGRHGKEFEILKFRSMRAEAHGPLITSDGDPRITRSGRFLRAAKLDELPQLFNVVEGTMSLVGPRPEVPKYVAMWPATTCDLVLSVRPGMTDPASLQFRSESALLACQSDPEQFYITTLMPQKLAFYEEYVRNCSVRSDLAILARTVRSVVGTRA